MCSCVRTHVCVHVCVRVTPPNPSVWASVSTHPFVYLSVLQLDEAGADSGDVALLVREGHTARSLGVLQLRVCVDARVADAPVQAVHDHGQLHCSAGHSMEATLWVIPRPEDRH